MKRPLLFSLAALLLVAGCKPSVRESTPLQRKQAANLVSEAQFAVSLRDFARAEPLLTQAVELCPDEPNFAVALGSARVRLNDKSGAKQAYETALKAFEAAQAKDAKDPELLLQQAYVLALLGRADDARALLEKTAKKYPDNRAVRAFVDSKQLDRLLADPGFKAIAL